MHIQLNGETVELPDGATVADLLVQLQLTERRVAVELNLDIVPRSLHGAPLLIPGAETVVRSRLQRWFAEQQIQPQIVGEFDDSALMQAFGQSGSGIFIAPSVIADEVVRQYGVALIGQTVAVTESFYAISVERKVKHPGIVAITEGARRELFTAL